MKKFLTGAFALLMFLSFTAATVSALPPGLAKRGPNNLPPGLDKKYPDNLPPGLQRLLNGFQLTRTNPDQLQYDTKIKSVDVANRRIVTEEGRSSVERSVSRTADIYLDGRRADLEELIPGDAVKLTVNNEDIIIRIVAISGSKQRENLEKVEGYLNWRSINNRAIEVKIEDKDKLYDLNENVRVWIDGDENRLSQLEIDMKIVLWLDKEDEVVEIHAYSFDGYYDAKVVSINKLTQSRIIKVEINDQEKEFAVARNVELFRMSSLNDLSRNSNIQIFVDNDVITKIWKK